MSDFYAQMIGAHSYQEEMELRQAQEAAHELEQERVFGIEQAIREFLTLGGSIENVKILCSETGVSYDRITGGM